MKSFFELGQDPLPFETEKDPPSRTEVGEKKRDEGDSSRRRSLRSMLSRWLMVTHVTVMLTGIISIVVPLFCNTGTALRSVQPWIRLSVYSGGALVGMGVLVSIARAFVDD